MVISPLKENQSETKTDKKVTLHVSAGIAHVVLSNPPTNLMDEAWSKQIQEIIDRLGALAEAKEIRGVVLSSNGRHFSAGANLESLEAAILGMKQQYLSSMLENSLYFEKLYDLPVPVVAAIRGVCIGSGLELALACHYRIADTRMVMGSVEATFGIMPGCGATIRLPKFVGAGRALELIMGGRRLDAEEAFAMGLVSEVVHHSELITKAIEYIDRLSPWYEQVANG